MHQPRRPLFANASEDAPLLCRTAYGLPLDRESKVQARGYGALEDVTERMAGALNRLSQGGDEGVTEQDLRNAGFSQAQIDACIDEARIRAKSRRTRRIHVARREAISAPSPLVGEGRGEGEQA